MRQKNETQQPEEGAKEALTEYGRAYVERRMTELARFAEKQNRLIFAYKDAAVSFANFGPFDPRGVETFRQKMAPDKPWGCFVGRKGCPGVPKEPHGQNATAIPGMVILDGKAYGEAGGKLFPVVGVLRRGGGYIPVLDIPQMDEQPSRKAAGA